MKKLVLFAVFALTMISSVGFSQTACYGVTTCADYCSNGYGGVYVCGSHQATCTSYGQGCSWRAIPNQGVSCTGNDSYGNWASWTVPCR